MIRTGFLLAGVLCVAACSSSGDRNNLYYGSGASRAPAVPSPVAAAPQSAAPIYVTPYREPLAAQVQPVAQPAPAQVQTAQAPVTRPVPRQTSRPPAQQQEVVARAATPRFASGPISKACLSANRKAANRRLCGCVQSVANRSLSQGDQRLAATFFANPHRAQEVRQSDSATKEVFWKRYKAFAKSAEGTCKGL